MLKRFTVPLLFAFLLAGCATDVDNDPNAPNVTLHLAPLESAPNAYIYGGAVNIPFELSIVNSTNQAVKLERIEIRTIGSGAYTIRSTSTRLNLALGAGETKAVQLSVWGVSRGGQMTGDEPVTLRAAAYLSGPSGPFVRLFTEYLTQP
jgi:hypothetical protein